MSKNGHKNFNEYKNGVNVFGYEIEPTMVSDEEIKKIRRMVNSDNINGNVSIKIDGCGSEVVVPKIEVSNSAYHKLYMIFINDKNKKSILVFKTVFYDHNDNMLMTSYEFAK